MVVMVEGLRLPGQEVEIRHRHTLMLELMPCVEMRWEVIYKEKLSATDTQESYRIEMRR